MYIHYVNDIFIYVSASENCVKNKTIRKQVERLQVASWNFTEPAIKFRDETSRSNSMAIALNLQRFQITNGVPKNNRSIRENRRGEAANVCDRSGSTVDERFAGWKASPSCWKDAGEAEWWRHGRCGQVARKDAAGRSPVHPFAPFRPLATDCPLRCRSLYMPVFTDTYTHTQPHRGSLFLSSDLSSPAHSLLLLYPGDSPFPPVDSSPL